MNCLHMAERPQKAPRLLGRAQAYQGTISSRSERLLRRQVSPPRPVAPRNVLLRRPKLAETPRRDSKVSSEILSGLRRAARQAGVKLSDPQLRFLEQAVNEVVESESDGGHGRSSQAKRRQKASLKRRKAVASTQAGAEGSSLSYLERESVTGTVQVQYRAIVDAFLKAFPQTHPRSASDPQVDQYMTEFMNQLYLEGHDANVGDKLIAAWNYFFPQFSRKGMRGLPRVARTLKGWHRHCPARSRVPAPWIVVAMIVVEMLRMGEPAMACWVVISFWAYLRPSECMRLRRKDLIPPVPRVTRHWSLLVAPSEAGILTTKVGEQDDTIVWDSQEVLWMQELLRELRGDGSNAPLWKFSYADLVLVWRGACATLKLRGFVPYQLRHGGPSHDRSEQVRSLEQIQKRGRWRQLKSVMRYEKAGRIAAEVMKLSVPMRRYAVEAAAGLKGHLTGRRALPILPSAEFR